MPTSEDDKSDRPTSPIDDDRRHVIELLDRLRQSAFNGDAFNISRDWEITEGNLRAARTYSQLLLAVTRDQTLLQDETLRAIFEEVLPTLPFAWQQSLMQKSKIIYFNAHNQDSPPKGLH